MTEFLFWNFLRLAWLNEYMQVHGDCAFREDTNHGHRVRAPHCAMCIESITCDHARGAGLEERPGLDFLSLKTHDLALHIASGICFFKRHRIGD